MFIPELLAPAGDMDKFRACVLYGADAVYLGGKSGNLRSACEGFGKAELALAVREATEAGVSVYYCLNSLATEADLPPLPEQLEHAVEAGVHGLIIADPGVLRLAGRYAPNLPVHLSTQANTSNSEAVRFWAEQGVSRVNLARELSCRDIYAIRRSCPDMELEVFIHGAMCLALSGQCLLSAWLNDRSGNKGRCTQPCRFEYRGMRMENETEGAACLVPGFHAGCGESAFDQQNMLVVEEKTRPGEALWRTGKEGRFSSFWAPWDLCLMPWLPWFVRNRITALKIEGRMKSSGWLAHVVDAYRFALNALAAGRIPPREELMPELFYAATRPLGSGFFLHGRRRNLTEEFLAANAVPARSNRSGESLVPALGRRLLARVLEEKEKGVWLLEVNGNWRRDKDVELMLPGLRRPLLIGGSYGLENQRGQFSDLLGNGTRGLLYADVEDIRPGIFIREAE